MRVSSPSSDLLDYQRGIIARWQLTDHRADIVAADALLRRGRWQTLYRGVYAAYSGRPSRAGIVWAAVLRCGQDAVLSHFTAAELDRLLDKPSRAIYVTIPQHKLVRIAPSELAGGLPPIVAYRSLRLEAARHPARTPPRTRVEETVLDLVNVSANFDAAFGWLTTACGRRLVTPAQLSAAAAQRRRLRWREDLRGALEEITDGVMSALERRYVRDVERPHGLPRPQRQAKQRRGETTAYLDNYYPDQRLAVELDGLAAHPPETSWDDRHRDNYFIRLGIATMRFNWADVTQRSCEIAGDIADVLRKRGWTGEFRRCPSCPVRLAA
jgi:hypothetical protein